VPILMQVADLGGPILVGLVILGANLAITELLIAACERRRWTRSVVAAGLGALVASVLYGALRIRETDARSATAPEARVGVVQANMGLLEKRSHYDEGLRRHFALSQDLRRIEHADFLVWSETSAMRAVREESYQRELRSVSRSVGAPVLFGAVIVKPVSDEREYVLFNAAVAGDEDGRVRGRYDKEYLLAFGEYLPFGNSFPILYKWSPNSGHFSPGTSLDGVTMNIKGVDRTLSVLICYEDVLPGFTNDMVRHANPELLVNITNDAWFGDTAEPWEHLGLAQFRAVEHHRYLVRGTNSGVSAVVDPVGRVVAHSQMFRSETIASTVRWLRGRTAYEVVGDIPWMLVSVLAVVAAFLRRVSRAA
jgi:apolipoprotein N-acyltransferase